MTEGIVNDAIDKLRSMIADCATFRTFVAATGEDDEAIRGQALSRVFIYGWDDPAGNEYTYDELSQLIPCAIIELPEENVYRLEHTSGRGGFSDGGAFEIHLETWIDAYHTRHARPAFRSFVRDASLIVAELANLSGVSPYLTLSGISLGRPARVKQSRRAGTGDSLQVKIDVTHGNVQAGGG